MSTSVAGAETVRRQNRGLILSALRREGPLSRTRLAAATGLSHASITAIGGDLLAQNLIVEMSEAEPAGTIARTRGRPATRLSFNRSAGHALLVEFDVGNARFSLIDYAGTLVDRLDVPLTPPMLSAAAPAILLGDRIDQMRRRNPEALETLRRIDISVQGVLDRSGDGLRWSPIANVGGQSIAGPLAGRFGMPVQLIKRGPLLAEGTRLIYPQLRDASLATVFIGSTVAMGLSLGRPLSRSDGGATEFGHMNHVPAGALCRCGMQGCVEAYAADYGVLRSAYGVPADTPPAPSVPPAEYQELIRLAKTGRRGVIRAFHEAGRAIGYGLSRLLAVADLSHVVIAGPGANAFELMHDEIEAALGDSLVGRLNGLPAVTAHHDEREPIFQGMVMRALAELDEDHAALPGPAVQTAAPRRRA